MPSSASARMRSSSLAVGARLTLPNTAARIEPCPMNVPRLGVIPVFAVSSRAGLSGTGEKPSGPVMSVVTPWRT